MAQTASEGRYGITKKLLNKLRGIPADFNYASVLSDIAAIQTVLGNRTKCKHYTTNSSEDCYVEVTGVNNYQQYLLEGFCGGTRCVLKITTSFRSGENIAWLDIVSSTKENHGVTVAATATTRKISITCPTPGQWDLSSIQDFTVSDPGPVPV